MKKGDRVLVEGRFEGHDRDGNMVVSFVASCPDGMGDTVDYYPESAMKPDHARDFHCESSKPDHAGPVQEYYCTDGGRVALCEAHLPDCSVVVGDASGPMSVRRYVEEYDPESPFARQNKNASH